MGHDARPAASPEAWWPSPGPLESNGGPGHWRANFSGANRWGANLGESQVLKANSGLFVLAVSFVVSGLP